MKENELEDLRSSLLKKKERVLWLYKKFNQTIQSDNNLIDYYKWVFGSAEKIEATLKRWGRKLRQDHKYCTDDVCLKETKVICFRRTAEGIIKAEKQEKVHLEVLGYRGLII